MLANYGYKDGSGEFFITIDTDKCNGCGECVKVCPNEVLMIDVNEFDLEESSMVMVKDEHRKKLKYSCAACKPVSYKKNPPCVLTCQHDAIVHSW